MPPKNFTALKPSLMPKQANQSSHTSSSIVRKMWITSIVIGLGLYGIFLLYLFIQQGSFSSSLLSTALAATAATLIGFSFGLSSMSYYFNFLDTKIGYRKYFGLTGYGFALLYSISLLFVDKKIYLDGFSTNLLTPNFLLGLCAMSILTFMMLISNNKVMKLMGPKNWRIGLRLGYVAYILLIIRAAVLEGNTWIDWFQSPNSLPPLRLIISIFAATILTLRLSMVTEEIFNKKSEKTNIAAKK